MIKSGWFIMTILLLLQTDRQPLRIERDVQVESELASQR